MQAGGQLDRKKLCKKGPRVPGGQQVEHEPVVLMCSFPTGNDPWIMLTSEPFLGIVWENTSWQVPETCQGHFTV